MKSSFMLEAAQTWHVSSFCGYCGEGLPEGEITGVVWGKPPCLFTGFEGDALDELGTRDVT